MLLFGLLLSFAQAQVATPAGPWTLLKTETIAAIGNPELRQIPLQVVIENDSKWMDRATLLAHLKKSSGILEKCGVAIGEIEVRTIKINAETRQRIRKGTPRRMNQFGHMLPAEFELTEGELSSTRPVMFMMSAKSYQYPSATAYNRRYVESPGVRSFPEAVNLLDFTFMTEQYITNAPNAPAATATYSTMAHELVHLLGNLGHINVRRNIMSEFGEAGMQTGDLVQEQCDEILKYPH